MAAKLPDIKALGYQSEFLRLWEFYLCYCEGGFLERSLSVVHLLYAKSGWRPPQCPHLNVYVLCYGPHRNLPPTLKAAVENLVKQGAASENKKPVLWGILPP